MKYCPYCGADLIEDAVSFCAECGKQLPAGKAQKEKPKEKHEIKKTSKKKKKNPVKKAECSIEVETVVDDGYDGYYGDIRPVDEDHEREGRGSAGYPAQEQPPAGAGTHGQAYFRGFSPVCRIHQCGRA